MMYRVWTYLLMITSLFSVQTYAQHGIYSFKDAAEEDQKALSGKLLLMLGEARELSITYPDSALKMLDYIYKTAIPIHDHPRVIDGLLLIGILHNIQGNYNKAEQAYLLAFDYNIKHSADINYFRRLTNASRILNNLGNTYSYKGDHEKSTYYYFEAIRVAESDPKALQNNGTADPLIRIYNNTAGALIKLKEYNKALYYLDKAIALAEKISLPQRTPSILANKAIVYNKLGQKDKSWEYNQRALALAQKYNFPDAQVYTLIGIGELLIEQKKSEKAIPYLEKALTVKKDIAIYYRVSALYLLGEAYRSLKQKEQAVAYFQQVLEKSQGSNIPEYIVLAHKQLAILYGAINQYQEAFEHSQAASRLSEKLLDKDKTQTVMALDVKYRTAQKDKELAQKQLLITTQDRRLEHNKTLIASITTGSVFLIVLLIAVYITYKNKFRLQKKEQEVNQLRANIQGEEKERSRIARELHDGIAGMINSVKMNLIVTQDDFRDLSANNHFRFAMRLLDETASEIRQTAHNLTPDILSQNELQDAINIFCEQVQTSSELNIKFMHYGFFSHLDDTFKLTVYRIVQELINNIVKHARADNAIVQISCYGHIFTITVEDDGIGLNTDNIYNGIGLQTMQARVKGMNGKMSIDTTDHSGTAIFIELHLPTNTVIPEYEHKNINS